MTTNAPTRNTVEIPITVNYYAGNIEHVDPDPQAMNYGVVEIWRATDDHYVIVPGDQTGDAGGHQLSATYDEVNDETTISVDGGEELDKYAALWFAGFVEAQQSD